MFFDQKPNSPCQIRSFWKTKDRGERERGKAEFYPREMRIQKTFLVNKAGKSGAVFWGGASMEGETDRGINSLLGAPVPGSPLVFQAAPPPPSRSQRPEGKETLKPVR